MDWGSGRHVLGQYYIYIYIYDRRRREGRNISAGSPDMSKVENMSGPCPGTSRRCPGFAIAHPKLGQRVWQWVVGSYGSRFHVKSLKDAVGGVAGRVRRVCNALLNFDVSWSFGLYNVYHDVLSRVEAATLKVS